MQTHSIHVTDGREQVLEVRSTLFGFPGVLEVFVTGRPDVLIVVCSGHPRPAQWLAALRAAGYEVPIRRRARRINPDLRPNAISSKPRIGIGSLSSAAPRERSPVGLL